MHYLMYIIAAISISLVPVLEQEASILAALFVAGITICIGLDLKRRRSVDQVQTMNSEKQNTETVTPMVSAADTDPKSENQNTETVIPMESAAGTDPKSEKQENNEHQEMIGRTAASVVGLLDLQLMLLSHLKDVEKNHFTIGYLFGLLDGTLQIRGIDINDDIALEILDSVLKLKYSNSDAAEVLDIYAKETKNQNSLFFRGMSAGGEDVFNHFKHDTNMVGLLNYFDPMPDKPSDEAHDEPSDEVRDEPSDEAHDEPSDDEATIEKRLKRLAALHRDGLITKKVLEEKQAEIVSKI